MKKILFALLLLPFVGQAQKSEGESVITAGAGYSLLGALFSIDVSGNTTTDTYTTPAMHFSYDYGITDNMSLGLAVGYQKFGIKYNDYEYVNADGNTVVEDFDWKLSRLNIGARALFHYGSAEKLDMYSGLRLGYQNFSSKATTTDSNFDVDNFKAGAFGVQLVAFGARGYFTDNIGFNFELAIGSPYLVMGGLSYRFGGM